VRFCKHFKILILEKLGLAFIMNFIEFHRHKNTKYSEKPRYVIPDMN
jgi:hypothetical protein